MNCSDYIRPTTFRTGIEYNGRYTKLSRKVGKVNLDVSKIIKAKEFLNSTTLLIKHQCHIFFQKVIQIFDIQQFFIAALNHVYSLIRIKLSVVVRNMGITIASDQYTFTIKRPKIYSRRLFGAREEWITAIRTCFIRISFTSLNVDVITQFIH